MNGIAGDAATDGRLKNAFRILLLGAIVLTGWGKVNLVLASSLSISIGGKLVNTALYLLEFYHILHIPGIHRRIRGLQQIIEAALGSASGFRAWRVTISPRRAFHPCPR
jgi:hypothetical protein